MQIYETELLRQRMQSRAIRAKQSRIPPIEFEKLMRDEDAKSSINTIVIKAVLEIICLRVLSKANQDLDEIDLLLSNDEGDQARMRIKELLSYLDDFKQSYDVDLSKLRFSDL